MLRARARLSACAQITVPLAAGDDADQFADVMANPVYDRLFVRNQLATLSSDSALVQEQIKSTDIREQYQQNSIVVFLPDFRDVDGAADALIAAVGAAAGKAINLQLDETTLVAATVTSVENEQESPSNRDTSASSNVGLVAGAAAAGVVVLALVSYVAWSRSAHRANGTDPARRPMPARAVNPAHEAVPAGDDLDLGPEQRPTAHVEADLEQAAGEGANEGEYLDQVQRMDSVPRPDSEYLQDLSTVIAGKP